MKRPPSGRGSIPRSAVFAGQATAGMRPPRRQGPATRRWLWSLMVEGERELPAGTGGRRVPGVTGLTEFSVGADGYSSLFVLEKGENRMWDLGSTE